MNVRTRVYLMRYAKRLTGNAKTLSRRPRRPMIAAQYLAVAAYCQDRRGASTQPRCVAARRYEKIATRYCLAGGVDEGGTIPFMRM
jgi:hypothetical protein